MSTDPQWDAAARRRRGQRGQQNVGQAMQGIGSQLFGYLAQQKMLDDKISAEQGLLDQNLAAETASQFTLNDLSMLVGGQGATNQATGPLADLFPNGFEIPEGMDPQTVLPPHLMPALRDPFAAGVQRERDTFRSGADLRLAQARGDINRANTTHTQGFLDNRQQVGLDFRGRDTQVRVGAANDRAANTLSRNEVNDWLNQGKAVIGPNNERFFPNPVAAVALNNNLGQWIAEQPQENAGLLERLIFSSEGHQFTTPDGIKIDGKDLKFNNETGHVYVEGGGTGLFGLGGKEKIVIAPNTLRSLMEQMATGRSLPTAPLPEQREPGWPLPEQREPGWSVTGQRAPGFPQTAQPPRASSMDQVINRYGPR